MPKKTYDEAIDELKRLSPDDKALFEQIKAYCADCRKCHQQIRRRDVRDKFKCGNEKVVDLMGILEALEGPAAPSSSADAGPQVPPDVAETTKADFDRIQQTYDDAFLRALRDQSERDRQAFQSEIDSGKVALRVMTEKFTEAEEMNFDLSADVRIRNEANTRLTDELARTQAERDGAVDQVKVLTAAKDSSEQQVVILSREIADVRQMNSLLVQEQTETRHERDGYRHQRDEYKQTASLVPDLRIELATCKTQIEGRINEAHQYRSTIHRMAEEHARELTHIRQEHNRTQDDARQTITEMRQLLAALGRRPVDA